MALSTVESGLGDVEGATDAMAEALQSGPEAAIDRLRRMGETAIVPLIDFLNSLNDATVIVAAGLGLAAKAAIGAAGGFGNLATALGTTQLALGAVGLAALAWVGVAEKAQDLNNKLDEGQEKVNEKLATYNDLAAEMVSEGAEVADVAQEFADRINNAKHEMDSAGRIADIFVDQQGILKDAAKAAGEAIRQQSSDYDEYVAAVEAANNKIEAQSGKIAKVSKLTFEHGNFLAGLTAEAQRYKDATTAVNLVVDQNSAAMETQTQIIEDASYIYTDSVIPAMESAAEKMELQRQRTLESTDLLDLYTHALETTSMSTEAVSYQTVAFSESLGITATAQEQARADAELLAAAYEAHAITLPELQAGLQSAASGTLVLDEAQRVQLESAVESAAVARDVATARKEAEKATADQAKATAELAMSFKDATKQEFANKLIGMLDPQKMGADAYGEAVAAIGKGFGLMDEQSIALAQNIGDLAMAIEDGVVPTENLVDLTNRFYEDSRDGQIDLRNLLNEFGRAPGTISPVAGSFRDVGEGVRGIADNAEGAVVGISDIGDSAAQSVDDVADFALGLEATEANLLGLVSGSPWTVTITAGDGDTGGGGGGGGGGIVPMATTPLGIMPTGATATVGAASEEHYHLHLHGLSVDQVDIPLEFNTLKAFVEK